jgi:hypothetical protein
MLSISLKTLCLLSIVAGTVSSTAYGQSYSLRFAPQSTNGQTYACLDQYNRPIPYAGWNLSNGVYFYTNAHYHGGETTQPVSTLSRYSGYSDGSGYFTFNIVTKLVGQAEYVDFACYYGGSVLYGRFDHAVGYFLDYVDVPSIWRRIGGDDTQGGTGHGSTYYNRYMNVASATMLYNASVAYRNAHPGVTHLCTNDMALFLGGKFDIGTATRWASPHAWHDNGTAADVAGVGSAQCANQGGTGVNVQEFIDRCVDAGAGPTWSIAHADHAHCGFANPTSFPH